ncbi:MAG: VWA domain-containing protein [Parachlamydiaceae bacterium]|nr:VWA domain-containing protein [Parachlamydiaceae bacterium]
MITFAWPYLFFLLPLPWIIYKCLPAIRSNQLSIRVPALHDFECFVQETVSSQFNIKFLTAFLIWVLLLIAVARPQWIGDPIEIPQSGRDLMLAVDLSGSMEMPDFEINGKQTDRLSALKMIASDFIDRRKGDRLGLILFGSNAYLQAPLTFDISTIKKFLNEASIGLAGNETAIGDAIGLAIKQLKNDSKKDRVLILLTDGNNNTGNLTPKKAAEIASHEGLKIYTIAIGANQMRIQTPFGQQVMNPSAGLDETTLKMISDVTGGRYFRAYNTKELIQVYQHIDLLEKIERQSKLYRPTVEMYMWPLGIALILLSLLFGVDCFRRAVR